MTNQIAGQENARPNHLHASIHFSARDFVCHFPSHARYGGLNVENR